MEKDNFEGDLKKYIDKMIEVEENISKAMIANLKEVGKLEEELINEKVKQELRVQLTQLSVSSMKMEAEIEKLKIMRKVLD